MKISVYKNALITTIREQFLGWIEIDENKNLLSINKGKTDKKGVDCKKNILMPGFIDSHTHGGWSFSFDNDLKNIEKYQQYINNLKNEGVVAFVGSSVTSTLEKLNQNIDDVKKILNIKEENHVKMVGWYYEGPFISKAKKGAHEEELIIPIDEDFLINVKNKLKNYPIIFTVDAENDENKILIKKYQNDFIFALGHSNANYKDAKYSLNNGIKRITHLYNGMSGFSHSGKLGIINVMFNKEFDQNINIELIADGVHVADEVIRYTYQNFNINNLSIITDSLPAKGMIDGEYKLGNLNIEKKGNWCYLKNSTTLSGSALPYNEVLKHFKYVTNCSWEEIVKISSYNSARNLKLDNNFGDFIIGKKLNFVILDDNFNIIETYI